MSRIPGRADPRSYPGLTEREQRLLEDLRAIRHDAALVLERLTVRADLYAACPTRQYSSGQVTSLAAERLARRASRRPEPPDGEAA